MSQCDHIVGHVPVVLGWGSDFYGGYVVRWAEYRKDGRSAAQDVKAFKFCPECGAPIDLTPIHDEWARAEVARDMEEDERRRLLAWPI